MNLALKQKLICEERGKWKDEPGVEAKTHLSAIKINQTEILTTNGSNGFGMVSNGSSNNASITIEDNGN